MHCNPFIEVMSNPLRIIQAFMSITIFGVIVNMISSVSVMSGLAVNILNSMSYVHLTAKIGLLLITAISITKFVNQL